MKSSTALENRTGKHVLSVVIKGRKKIKGGKRDFALQEIELGKPL